MRVEISSKAVAAAVWMAVLACGGSSSSTPVAPTFSPPAGTYSSAQTVAIVSATAGASIVYTTDDSTPTILSARYTAPISVTASTTLKAVAVSGSSASSVSTARYIILGAVAAPTFSPPAGTYTSVQTVTISSTTPGSSLFYTTDGSTPTTSSTPYTGPVTVGSSLTLKAIATAAGYSSSAVGMAAYVIDLGPAAAPTFSPPGGYYRGVTVTLSSSSPGTTVHYTADGSAPTSASTPYAAPIVIPDGSPDVTIRAMAAGNGFSPSAVASATYSSRTSFPFSTPGCYASGSALGGHGEAVFISRASSATYLDGSGMLQACPAGSVRIGCDSLRPEVCGLLVEPSATQLYPTPTSPGPGTVTFSETGWHQFWVVGSGSQTLTSSGTLVAAGLPCTASDVSPCSFNVTSLGASPTATLSTVTGTFLRAQIEAGAYRTSFIPGGTRATEMAWVENPLAGTVNHVARSEELTAATWVAGTSVIVTADQPDSVGGSTAVRATVTDGLHFYSQAGVQVTGGTAYTWSFDARNNGGTAASYSVYCAEPADAAGDIVPPTSYVDRIDDSTWTRVAVPFTVPAACTSINVYLLRDSGPGVDLYLGRAQLETGSAFTSYSRTRDHPIAADVSGGSWCVQGTWTPENGAPWASPMRTIHYRVLSTFEADTRNSFFMSASFGGMLTWDVFGADNLSKRLVPAQSWADGSTHTLAGAYASGTLTHYEDGTSVGTPGGAGNGVMDAQKGKLGLTPLAGDAGPANQPFGGFLQNLVVYRNAACN